MDQVGGKKEKATTVAKTKPTFAEVNSIIESDFHDNVTGKLSTKDLEPIERLLFKKQYVQYTHMYDSYNRWIDRNIREFLIKGRHIIDEEKQDHKIIRHLFRFSDIEFHLPKDDSPAEKIITPTIAKIRNLTYASKMTAKVEQIVEVQDIQTKATNTRVLYSDVIPIGKIPIMTRSAFCVTQPNIAPNVKNTECKYDPGCGFIIKGSEKVIISLEKIADDRIYVFTSRKKNAGFEDDLQYFAHISSKAQNIYGNIQACKLSMRRDNSIIVTIKDVEVNLFVMMRALGIESDYDIYSNIVYDINDTAMVNVVKQSLFANNNEPVTFLDGKVDVVTTQAQAIEFLKSKMKSKKFSDTNPQDKADQQYAAVIDYLKNDFLPHLGTDEQSILVKGKTLGYMVHRLLLAYLKRDQPDNRDSYIHKRMELPGELLDQLFKPSVRKMINETSKKFKKKRRGVTDTNYPNVISQILQSNTIEMNLNQSLATGTWGARRKGVAQLLQRFTFMQSYSYLRRFQSASNDQSNNRVISMRHVDQHCYGYIDSIETPEGQKVGMVKNLALSATVTLPMPEQIPIIRKILLNVPDDIEIFGFDIPMMEYKKLTKIFINGEWIGFTNKAFKLIDYLKGKRFTGELHRHVGITYKTSLRKDTREIRINTDGGRMIRPLLCVKNNQLVVTKAMLDKINNLSYDIPNKINSLEQFLQENPGTIEYVDVEESTNALVAMYAKNVADEYEKMTTIVKNPNPHGDPVDRYANVYKRFTHCEFHPMMMLGSITSNIPLMEHNQSPRNYYNFSQVRQAMGISTSNYKRTATITFALYHTAKPLVISRAAEYTHTDMLPAGENAVVAIASYGGYNQEDSIVMNLSAIDRGLFRASAYKKYEDVAKKSSSGQEDEFGIKDKSLVKGLNDKEKNYNKVNEQGFAPEETKLENGDIMIAKVTRMIDKDAASKAFKDESQPFKSNRTGYVDRVWHNKLTDGDGYPLIKMRVRTECIPIVGDKFCMLNDHEILTTDGWINITQVTRNHRVATMQNGDVLEYHNPTDIQELDYKGDMYTIKSNQVDLKVTSNHRMYVGDREGKRFKIELASDIYGKRRKYMKNIKNTNLPGLSSFIIPSVDNLPILKLPINEWLTFFGIWIAEGWIHNNRGIRVSFAAHKQRVKDALVSISEVFKCEIQTSKDKADAKEENIYEFVDKRLNEYMRPYSVGAINKYLPEWVWQLNQEQCKTLIAGMMLGDGHTMENGTQRYDTSSTKLADDFQRLCLHAGYSCNKTVKYEAGHESIKKNGEVIKQTVDAYRLTVITTQNTPLVNKNIKPDGTDRQDSLEPYEGKVYCCTVPGPGIIYVRRNGVPVWTGNCSRHGRKLFAGKP